MFIRVKRIKKYLYAYLVKNLWDSGSTRQKVVSYLGRVYEIQTPQEKKSYEQILVQQVIQEICLYECSLHPHIEINFNTCSVTIEKKDVIIKLNQGFLCTHTLTELKKALVIDDEQRPGLALAEAITRAGLRVDQKTFIKLYVSRKECFLH